MNASIPHHNLLCQHFKTEYHTVFVPAATHGVFNINPIGKKWFLHHLEGTSSDNNPQSQKRCNPTGFANRDQYNPFETRLFSKPC